MEDHSEILNQEVIIKDGRDPWYKGPLKYILLLFLLFLLLLWAVPKSAIKVDPEPRVIPSIEEVLPPGVTMQNTTYDLRKDEYLEAFDPSNPQIKQLSNSIVSMSCDSNNLCYAKALYYFVRDNLNYISDPVGDEYIEHPFDFLLSGGGDCESGSILLATMLRSIGIYSEMYFIPGHAMVRIKLQDPPKKYLNDDNYIYLDWTCKNCDFGQAKITS